MNSSSCKIRLLGFFLLLSIAFASQSKAQKVYTDGKLIFKITDIEVKEEANARGAKMMKGKKIKVYFTPDQQRTDISIMGGMAKMSVITNSKDTNAVVLMKMMGQKMKMTMNEEMAESFSGRQGHNLNKENVSVKHYPSVTKEILEFKTHLVELTFKGDDGRPMVMKYYVTNQIKTPKSISNQLPDDIDLGGIPLEYEIVTPDVTIKYEAVDFEPQVDKDIFIIPEGYKEIDPSIFDGMSGN